MPASAFPHNFRNVLPRLGLHNLPGRLALLCAALGLLMTRPVLVAQVNKPVTQAAEALEPLAAEDGALAEVPPEESLGEPAPAGGVAADVAESAEQTVDALVGDGEVPATPESAEEAAVDQAEDQAISAPVESTVESPIEPPVDVAPEDAPVDAAVDAPGDGPGELEELPAPLEGELLGEDLDLIPLPEGVDADGGFLDLPMVDGSDLLLPADIPPLDVAPALPPVPVGEPAKIISARYKQLRIKVEKDPAVVSLWEQSQAAGTYEQQRAGLREYYRLLFKKMREEDPTLTMRIDAMEAAYLRRLSQSIIEPTIPLEPPPKPEPLAPLP